MANIILIGGQWGDEGKGKVVDLLTPHFDVVARYSGGPNAGHTVRRGEQKYALRHIPSGILRPDVTCVIGNGVVIDPRSLREEIDALGRSGVGMEGRLKISHRAHVILPPYIEWETRREESAATGPRIGTTRRGVGPAYVGKLARTGVRVVDLDDAAALPAKLAAATALFSAGHDGGPGPLGAGGPLAGEALDALLRACEEHRAALRPYVCDTQKLMVDRIRAGDSVLFEGAQGTMLDIDHGTYPYVTSSNPSAGGACTGLGVPPTAIDGVLGIFKAYTSRVGEGPFPTEEMGEAGALIRERGHEYGTVTGRPRRCGWFDAVAARHAVRVNGMDCAALTLLDVLDAFDELKICTAYRYKGERLTELPAESAVLAACEPEYVSLPGWHRDTTGCRALGDLPEAATGYVHRIEELIECDIDLISVAPGPEGSIQREVSKLSAWLSA
jgi:adenylosuccinate synthase